MLQEFRFTIDVPKGKEPVIIDDRIVFICKELPKTWDEFVNVANAKKVPFAKFDVNFEPREQRQFEIRRKDCPDFLPTFEDVEAHIAFIKLHNLRDYYRNSFKGDKPETYSIIFDKIDERFTIVKGYGMFLSFPSFDIAKSFLTNFEPLIQKAKELL